MAKNNQEGLIFHCVGIRYQIVGDGLLSTTVRGTGTRTKSLSDTVLPDTTDKMPYRLANFEAQSMQIQFGTTEINATFTLSKVVGYIKPVATEYPQGFL